MTSAHRFDTRGLIWGSIGVVVLVAISIVGSSSLVWFDAALVGYFFGLVFAVFGVLYRYSQWVRRPPTAVMARRGWSAMRTGGMRSVVAFPGLFITRLLEQRFIRHRSKTRWLGHQAIFWGCVLAGLVTIPLTMGIIHFESVDQKAERYQVVFAEAKTISFDAESIVGWTTFHLLDISAVLVLIGVFIFLRRRLHDPGALAVERGNDFLALAGLFAVSVTGLFLTVSSIFLQGRYYATLNNLHAFTVVMGLMYLPFGKLFHIFQQPLSLGVAYYRHANEHGEPAICPKCGDTFASAQQIADLQVVLPRVGFDYSSSQPGIQNYQDICPRCRRASVAFAQGARVGGFG